MQYFTLQNTTDVGIEEIITICQGECPQIFRNYFASSCADEMEGMSSEEILTGLDQGKDSY